MNVDIYLTESKVKLTMFHHHRQESDDDLRARSDENLTLGPFLCIANAFQRIGEYVHTNHLGGGSDEMEIR